MRHTTRLTTSAVLALLLVVGAFAGSAAAGLPAPPGRPNDEPLPTTVNGTYDGGVVVDREFERAITDRIAVLDVDCDEAKTLTAGPATRESEYGLSLAGPLTDEQVDGVTRAVEEFRPPEERTDPGRESKTIPRGKKGRLVRTETFVHTHYGIYLAQQGGGERVGTIHVETFSDVTVSKNVTDCNPPATKQGATDRDDSDPGDDGGWPDLWPFDDWFDAWFGNDGATDEEPGFAGEATTETAIELLGPSVQGDRLPESAGRFVGGKRLNVQVDGEYIGVRTGPDGTPEAIRTRPYDDPDGTVTLEDGVRREIVRAEEPADAVREAIVADRLEYRTGDPVAQAAFYAVETGAKLDRAIHRIG